MYVNIYKLIVLLGFSVVDIFESWFYFGVVKFYDEYVATDVEYDEVLVLFVKVFGFFLLMMCVVRFEVSVLLIICFLMLFLDVVVSFRFFSRSFDVVVDDVRVVFARVFFVLFVDVFFIFFVLCCVVDVIRFDVCVFECVCVVVNLW